VRTLGIKVFNGVKILLLYISAQISYPPSIHKFLSKTRQNRTTSQKRSPEHIPQCANSLNHHFLLTIRQPSDQSPNNIFSLQQSACRRVVLDKIGHSNTGPFTFCTIGAFQLWVHLYSAFGTNQDPFKGSNEPFG
jgi:hypothetical protein